MIPFSKVVMVSVPPTVPNPIIVRAINMIKPLLNPSSSPWHLLTLAAMYPPNNTLIASTASIMY